MSAPTPSTPAASRPSRGEELELTIDSLAFGGARRRASRRLRRVRPGRRFRATACASSCRSPSAPTLRREPPRSFSRARSGFRRSPIIRARPGRSSRYERQLEVKQAQVDDALRRIGKLDGYALEPIVPAVAQWRYRNKLEYSFGADPGDGRLVCGFHAPGRWNDIVEVTDCLLASEPATRRGKRSSAGAAHSRA